MQRPSKFRPNFIRDLVLVSLLLSGMIVSAVVFLSARAREEISQKYIDNATASAEHQYTGMAENTEQILELAGDWIVSGRISSTSGKEMNVLLFPLLNRNHHISGISVAGTEGKSCYLTIHGDGFMTREMVDTEKGRVAVRRFWDAEQKLVSEEKRPSSYDPRSRPWFSPALADKGIFWTPPYVFFEYKAVGITAAIGRQSNTDSGQIVVAFDILMDDLFRKIQGMAPSANSRVFIFRNDARIYLPGDAEASSDFRAMVDIDDPLIRKTVASWEKGHLPDDKAFAVNHDGQTWWCGFRPMAAANRHVWVGVMVPESDIMGRVVQRRKGLWALGGFVLLLTGGLTFLMLRRYGRSVDMREDGFDSRNPEKSVMDLVSKGEGRTVEFKSTMRLNLHTRKPGKEIELAWLKALVAFMNTDGGTLLLGVSDDGTVTGLEADAFASDDKCRLHFKNLVNQHIGAEFSKYLRLHLLTVDAKKVGVVACRRSSEPAYLKTAKSEEYYIRSGLSSDALPVSKVVALIQTRK
ncbi:RNA-binding domain-containing protein [uncultured Desulfosarcina sp.]|uniref:RNA-binding domain-containing protein n=1 Tax=uncultured Desulfosarcina sp. TaxID=218289 RepID=UPI0029C6C384|nr:RNA-binding domain-containing protein [uncultured Desulfosarcina sp.]